MQNFKNRIGIDVSKLTLDLHSVEHNKHLKISNDSTGFKQLLKWLKELGIQLNDVLFVMEFTGGYEYRLIQFFESKQIVFSRISGLAIKRSMGIVRGMNDKIDAYRIAQYADEKRKSIVPAKPINKAIISLKEALGFRKRLVRENADYQSTIKGRKDIYGSCKNDMHMKILKAKLYENQACIRKIEKEIEGILIEDEKLKINYTLLKSIKGIGMVNAAMTIAYTEKFTSFIDARRYAVYAGVIPFEYTSGTSIKGKKKSKSNCQ